MGDLRCWLIAGGQTYEKRVPAPTDQPLPLPLPLPLHRPPPEPLHRPPPEPLLSPLHRPPPLPLHRPPPEPLLSPLHRPPASTPASSPRLYPCIVLRLYPCIVPHLNPCFHPCIVPCLRQSFDKSNGGIEKIIYVWRKSTSGTRMPVGPPYMVSQTEKPATLQSCQEKKQGHVPGFYSFRERSRNGWPIG